jgi:hypothetical protein
MLPGFRFLFTAIVLTMSILVFGLGAAALLRAAHEEFASTPTWRAAPETVFAQPAEATPPVLALLRVDAPVTEKTPDSAPADATPAAIASAPAEPERIATLKPEDSPLPEVTKPENPVAETPVEESPAQNEATSAPADVPAAAADTRNADTKVDETKSADTKIAMSEEASSPANQAATPAASEPIDTSVSPSPDIAATKIATLGGPAVIIETPPPAKAASTKPDPSVIKKRQQAKRAAQRRRLATRARVAVQVPQQPGNPFGQPAPTIVRRR